MPVYTNLIVIAQFSTSIRHCLSLSINTLSHMEIRSTKSLEHHYKSDKALLNSTFVCLIILQISAI